MIKCGVSPLFFLQFACLQKLGGTGYALTRPVVAGYAANHGHSVGSISQPATLAS